MLVRIGVRERRGPLDAVVQPFGVLWRHRTLLFRTSVADLRARYAGSLFGLAWLVAYPLLFLGIYSLVYLVVFKVRLQLFDSREYVIMMFCGLIPFLGFSEALGLGVPSVIANRGLIRNTLYPIEMIPVKAVLLSQCNQAVGMAMLIVTIAVTGRLAPVALLVPVVWLLQILGTLGLIWVLATVNIYFRDLQASVSILNLVLLIASPIAYTVDMVSGGVARLLQLNPLYYLIISYRDLLFFGRFPRGDVFWILAALSLVSFYGGYWFVRRAKQVFADNV